MYWTRTTSAMEEPTSSSALEMLNSTCSACSSTLEEISPVW
jgi:hypothetical protein